MQPYEHVINLGRQQAARILNLPAAIGRGVVWAFMLVMLSMSVAGVAEAAPDHLWRDLPVEKLDWDKVRSMPGGEQILERELYRQGEYNRRWRIIHDLVGGQHVSRLSQELLSRQGLGPALLKGGQPQLATAAEAPDVLRVLIVRMGFETNRDEHLTTISPGGDFMLDPLVDPGPLEIDPPPHNKAFFESHLVGLSEYYKFMSGGRLLIEGTVLPAGDNDSYKLSDVADYGPGADSFWSLESLEQLVRDMIGKADEGLLADGGNGLSDYDDETPFTYVIFVHSGSDWQSDIRGDSPNDIPTFFITLGDSVPLGGVNGVGNPGRLRECSIIPETTNTDDFAGSIAAAFYHEFGHALGLPDVYDTQSGLPAVGIWDLMDSGTNLPVNIGTEIITGTDTTIISISATGVLPPSLSAWCKWYLGWLVTDEVSAPIQGKQDYLLPAVGVPREQYARYRQGFGDFDLRYPQAYRAGSSPREYFLIENRWVPLTVGETPFTSLKFERDEATGVVQYLAGQFDGVWENSGLYDFFMPGGGLLVWHVNNDRIESELANNTINAFGDGLRLVEADGIQDIGVLDAFVLGWFGSHRDPFGGFDQDGIPTGYNDLYTQGFPSSLNFDRSYSGLRLSEMGPRVSFTSSVMKFKATLEPQVLGFPWELAPADPAASTPANGHLGLSINTASLTPVSLAGSHILIFSDQPGADWQGDDFVSSLYGLQPSGRPRWGALSSPASWYEGAFQIVGAPIAGSILALDHRAGDGLELFWSTTAGTVGATHIPLGAASPSEIWQNKVGDSIAQGPLALQWQGTPSRLLVSVARDSLLAMDRLGNLVGAPLELTGPGGSAVAGQKTLLLPGADDGSDRAVVFTDLGWFLVEQDATGLVANPGFVSYDRQVTEVPQWAVVNAVADGRFSVRTFDDEGELGAWLVEADNAVTLGSLLPQRDGPLVCEPAVADLDGDGRNDVVMATATRIYAYQETGVALRGFPVRFFDLYPLSEDTRVQGPLVVVDGTGDGVNEIYFNTTGGHLVGLSSTGALLGNFPLRWGDLTESGLAVGGEGAARILWMASAGGYTNGFLDRNPVNGRLSGVGLLPTETVEKRTSEWLGPYGDSARRGTVGQPRALGDIAPVTAEKDLVYLYPNPLGNEDLTVRFFSEGARDARLSIYNLEGELVVSKTGSVTAGAVNELSLALSDIVSGLYLARLEYEGPGGATMRTLTLAVEK